ncbi:hypothetical protein Aph01nite_73650 [Acrocarpospora phusangensis]|uniref:Uncharacterized protein n=1 Tax=Acrocarpospora phusangensis TaxID=1070424 RepID=A0A919QKD2_9ACTN|nr:hypothetical protein [Acrocarpospora phusangensis]GIH29055.1 hypothetical protein Aph01nite_73650 [Acrocarpospora phusangensis]
MTSSPRGGTRRKRPVLVPVAALLSVSGLGVTAGLGGFAEAKEPPPPAAAQGAVVDQGRYRTQFIKAIETQARQPSGPPKRAVDLVLKVKNTGDQTALVGTLPEPGKASATGTTFASSLLKITPEIKTEYGPKIFVLSYGIESGQLHPDITATVVVRYEIAPGTPVPASLTVDVGKFEFRELGERDRTEDWFLAPAPGSEPDKFVPEVAARISLPVRKENA